tara:strand:+ start:5835 stop:6149 length:315 start_codon:yes stop_codon:yes gene_type:complete
MKGIICSCGKVAKFTKNLSFNRHKISGWVCKGCGEVIYEPIETERILLLNKLKKQMFNLKLSRVKSNLVLRIPKEVSDVLNLHKGELVQFRLKSDNCIEIKAKP